MTNFVNKNFKFDGTYLKYNGRFVARFKRGGTVPHDTISFKKFLCDNFTVEEYFDLLENQDLPPLKVLQTKGYVSPKVAKILKQRGYPMTLEGMNKMIDDDYIARRTA